MSYDPNTYQARPHSLPSPKGYAPGTRFYRLRGWLSAETPNSQRKARKRAKIRHGHQRCRHT
jgi:hypothetical protein